MWDIVERLGGRGMVLEAITQNANEAAGNLESGVGRRYLAGRKGRMEANSSHREQSAESSGLYSEDLGSRSYG